MQKQTVPANSPLIAFRLVCSHCGEFMDPVVVRNFSGQVDTLMYKHVSEVGGCSYMFEQKVYATVDLKIYNPDSVAGKQFDEQLAKAKENEEKYLNQVFPRTGAGGSLATA